MIYITQNQVNQLLFTLNEKREYSNSNFILDLYSNSNKTNQYIFLPNSGDTSLNQTRWNQWAYVETGDLEVGSYEYFAYETTGSTIISTSGLSVTETGKVVVIGSGSTIPTIIGGLQQYTFE